MQRARTVDEVRDLFEMNGQTVAQWAKDHGFSAPVVYALLSGRTRGRRGEAHRAAIALGLKRPVTAMVAAVGETPNPSCDLFDEEGRP